ncbi:MAG TPA: ElyC/SanA/YdcF family protein [Candidatus Thiothrix moscowensis]|uniref:YdcF family protein n=1 Tax=unclassified Thiothrix TaxID=2636184 RepID=UPI0025FB63E9|nr:MULTISPECIES: ElyC/SanA/YdcF family protein [unclassified Thiothrix]HRJ51226.1 ElyC/SanA/YdcF family protein [Candidatus Thiothrix moscowensis]HRJ91719.1 ElyC/SanA/YdcF family protein [Candidatus Thiothrix moscowensis]
MFLFKKLFSSSIMPLSLSFLLLLGGLLLLWLSRRQKTGKVLATLGFLLLLAQGYGWGFESALRSLEREYPPVVGLPADVRWVVVLGGGTSSDMALPLHSRLSEASLARLVEGVRLYRQQAGAKLLVSGGRVFGSGADADAMQALAVQLGVNPADIVLDMDSQDTETQAQVIRQQVGAERVALVTSASHMPRAVGLFRQAGVEVLPAPTHYLEQSNAAFSPTDVFPDSDNFTEARRAVYEYMGVMWAKLRERW